MADRSVKITVGANVAPLKAAMADGSRSVEGLAAKSTAAGSRIKSAFKMAAATGGVLSLGAAIKSTFSIGLDFTTQMNTLQAVTGATGKQMADASKKAQALGNDISIPATSASDAAQAMTELAKGGLTVSQAMQAAKGTLQLAAAAGVSGAQAAEIQANALNTFSLSASGAGHVADVLANTANAASGEITDFAQGMQQAGSVAKLFGINIEDTSTVLGLFANNGIKGSDAGTSLKTMLTQLATPSVKAKDAMQQLGLQIYDAQGKFVGMRELTDQLSEAQQHMSQQAFQSAAGIVFGSDAIRGASILASGGVAAYDAFAKSVDRAGGAADLANAKMKGLPGALQNLQNEAENVALSFYQRLSPAVESVTNGLSDGIGVVGPLVVSVFGGLIDVVGQAAGVFGSLPPPVKEFGLALAGLALANKIGLLGRLSSAASGVGSAVTGFGAAFARIGDDAAMAGVSRMRVGIGLVGSTAKSAGASVLGAFGGPWAIGLAAAATGVALLISKWKNAKPVAHDFTAAVDDNTGALAKNATQATASALGDTLVKWKQLGGNVRDYTQAVLGSKSAQDAMAAQIQTIAVRTVESSKAWKTYGSTITAAGHSADDVAAALLAGAGAGVLLAGSTSTSLGQINSVSSAFAGTLDNLSSATDQYHTDVTGMNGALAKAQVEHEAVAGAADKSSKSTKNAATSTKQMADASRDAAAAGDDTVAAMRETQLKMADAAKAATTLAGSVDEVEAALARLEGREPTVEQAMRQFNGTLTDAKNALKLAKGDTGTFAAAISDATGKINTNTTAGQKLYDWVTQSASAAHDAAAAQGDLAGQIDGTDGAAKAANKSLAQSRDAFMKAATAAGIAKTDAKKLADQYFGMPKDIEVVVRGRSDFSAVDNKLQTLADRKITVDVQGVYRAPRGLPARSFGNANAGLAGGGAITGPGTKGVDSKLAMLAPGEHVLTAKDVDALGGQSAVYALRSALHGGVASFATGGATSPGVRSLSGMSAPQLGPVASILAQALGGIDQAVQETSQSAADAADKLRSANDAYRQAVSSQAQTAKEQASRVKDVNTSTQQAIKDQKARLADAKASAAQSIKDAAARLREAKSDSARASAERSLAKARTSGAKSVAAAEKKLQDARDARVKKVRDAIRAESTANAKASSKTSQSLSALTSARSASSAATAQDLALGIASGSVADARTLGASRVAAQVSRQQSVARAQQANVSRVDKTTTAAITAAKSRLDELKKSSGGSAAALAHIATAERNVKKAQDARVVSLRNAIRAQTAANKAEATRTAQTKASAASLVTQAKNAASAQAAQSKLASMLDRTNDSLADATSKLADLRQQSSQLSGSVSSKIQGDTSIMGMDVQGVPGLLAGLKSNLASATAFGSDLRSLRARGLDTGILTDIAGGGLAAGPLASALARASSGQINQINRLQAQIRAVSGSTGDLVANANFGSDIRHDQNVVAAYQSTATKLMGAMAANAKSLNAALEAGLKGMVVQVQMDGKQIDARIDKIIGTQGRSLVNAR